MATDDYEVAPLVRSVSLEYVDALVNGAESIQRNSGNEDTRFTYTLWPDSATVTAVLISYVYPYDLTNVGLGSGRRLPDHLRLSLKSTHCALPP